MTDYRKIYHKAGFKWVDNPTVEVLEDGNVNLELPGNLHAAIFITRWPDRITMQVCSFTTYDVQVMSDFAGMVHRATAIVGDIESICAPLARAQHEAE